MASLSTSRGANMVSADPQQIGTPKDERWATGRNVKKALADHCWEAVEVWTLKRRDANGKVVVVDTHCSRERAEAWVATGR